MGNKTVRNRIKRRHSVEYGNKGAAMTWGIVGRVVEGLIYTL
jgi:hypothetical protein